MIPGVVAWRRASSWTPAALFANGEAGAWYDPSDLSTLFQDSAGTTPVTATGQPVGRMLDKSGNGYHVTQSTTTKRPVLRQDAGGLHYLDFDGVDDLLVTGYYALTGASEASHFIAAKRINDAFSNLISRRHSSDRVAFLNSGMLIGQCNGSTAQSVNDAWVAGSKGICSFLVDTSSSVASLRLNGSQVASDDAWTADPNFQSSSTSAIGAYNDDGNYPAAMHLYGAISVYSTETADPVNPEVFLAAKAGVTLP